MIRAFLSSMPLSFNLLVGVANSLDLYVLVYSCIVCSVAYSLVFLFSGEQEWLEVTAATLGLTVKEFEDLRGRKITERCKVLSRNLGEVCLFFCFFF